MAKAALEAQVNMECKFCKQQVASLVKSHIIARCFYRAALGQAKTFIQVDVDNTNLSRKQKQSGLFDNSILCEKCERLFSPYDHHGYKVITDLLTSKKELRDKFGKPVAYESTVGDYKLFKLFVLSLVWRASVSSLDFFGEVNLGRHEDKIRVMLATRNEGAPDDYPVICNYQTGQKYPSTVLPPYWQRTPDGINLCRFYLPQGIVFFVKVDRRPLPKYFESQVLKSGSTARFCVFPYLGSSEMEQIEGAKILAKKQLKIPLRTTYLYRKSPF